MKVLHVIETLGIGGAEQMLVTLTRECVRLGHEVEILALKPPLTLQLELESAGARVQVLPRPVKWNVLRGARCVGDAARRTGADVIHAHLVFATIYTGFARGLGLTRARTCVTFHNLAYAEGVNKAGPGLWLRRTLNGLAARHGMDGRIAVSRAVAEHYRAALGCGPVAVIPNGISLATVDAAAAAPRRAGLHVVLPGRLVREKGHAVLIEAAALLVAQGRDLNITFAGDGPLRAELGRRAEDAGLASRLTITGRLPHADLLSVLASADVVALPSLFEGFGMTAAEAMALRKPVVAARTGGLTDIVDDGVNGLLVPSGDADALAAAIARLADDAGLRHRLGAAGRRKVECAFDSRATAVRVADIYRGLTGAV